MYSPLGRAGLTTGCNCLVFIDKTEPSFGKGVADEDVVLEEDEDDTTASMEMELSFTDDMGVLLTNATVLPIGVIALRSKSSPSSSSSSYIKANIFVSTVNNSPALANILFSFVAKTFTGRGSALMGRMKVSPRPRLLWCLSFWISSCSL